MAHYTRFEIYLPVLFTISERDGPKKKISIDDSLVQEFIEDIIAHYGGISQANPLAQALYKGWWHELEKDGSRKSLTIDHFTYLFGLVAIDESSSAQRLFTEWKKHFEKTMN